jgi:hypothetical protein
VQLKPVSNGLQGWWLGAKHTICCGIVDSKRRTTNTNASLGAGRHIDIVIPSSIVSYVL